MNVVKIGAFLPDSLCPYINQLCNLLRFSLHQVLFSKTPGSICTRSYCCYFKISPQQSENSVLPSLLQEVQRNDNTADKSVKINYTFLQEIHIIPEYIITKQSG